MSEPRSRLARRLGTFDAVVLGLGAMVGAGVFAAFTPAARAAGNALLIGLAIAAAIAYANATASAALAARYPASGGTYIYGRERLGHAWGAIAGWAFVVGKLASCAAMAMTFGSYAWPAHARPLAIVAVVALTAVNCVGVKKTALVTRAIVVIVFAALAIGVTGVWTRGDADLARVWPLEHAGVVGILQAAGFLFFAFAGYARIATLGEEVIDPARTIPRAIPIALAIALVIYAIVAVSVLAGAGAAGVAASPTPLVAAGGWPIAARVGAAVASLGVLLSLFAGIGRTAFAMASNGDLPRALGRVHPRFAVPVVAQVAIGAIVVAVVAMADVRGAIGFSSFAVLIYYGITNAAAWTLGERRALAAFGLVSCLVIAATMAGTIVA